MVNIKDNDTVLFIGDSITDVDFNARMNDEIGGKYNYPLQVSDELSKSHRNLKFFYKGIASNRSYHVYDRLTADCIDLKPDVIILFIGVNDAWENYVPENYPPLLRPLEPHMKEIYRRIKAELPSARLITLLPFLIDTMEEKAPFHKVLDDYIKRLYDLALGNADEIIDLQSAFYEEQKLTEPYLLSHDGVHPTEKGHSVIAREVLKHIE